MPKKHEAENWPKNKKHLRNMVRLKFRKHKKWKKHEIFVKQTEQYRYRLHIHITIQKYQICFHHPLQGRGEWKITENWPRI